MLEYCTYACRSLIFIAILIILGYIILINEKKSDSGKRLQSLLEKFVDCDENCDVTKTELIRTVFRNYLGRDPTSEEIKRYGDMMTNNSDLMSVVSAVKSSDEYKQLIMAAEKKDFVLNMSEVQSSPLIADLEKVEIHKRLDTYREIAKIYNKNLDRMPNNRELTYYSHKLLTDQSFSLQKLEAVLVSSQEYKMIQKSQTNNVYGELQGNITDAQLTLDVRTLYKEVFDTMPLQEQEVFLKSKYIEYNLDKKKFLALLLLIKEMDDNRQTISKDGDVTLKTKMIFPEELVEWSLTMAEDTILDPVSGKPISLTGENSVLDEQWDNCRNACDTKKQEKQEKEEKPIVYQNPNIINIINPSPEELDKLLSTIDKYDLTKKEVNNSNAKKCYNNDYSKDPLYRQMGRTGTSSCAFSKDSLEMHLKSRDRQMLAEFQLTRDLDGLKNNCSRNTYFMNVDDEMSPRTQKENMPIKNISPSTSTADPTFGTIGASLSDAQKTHVGSIMPTFIYRETP